MQLKKNLNFLIKLKLVKNIYESIENGCIEQQYQTFASESEQLCKKKARRRKQNQQVERFFNLFEEISQENVLFEGGGVY